VLKEGHIRPLSVVVAGVPGLGLGFGGALCSECSVSERSAGMSRQLENMGFSSRSGIRAFLMVSSAAAALVGAAAGGCGGEQLVVGADAGEDATTEPTVDSGLDAGAASPDATTSVPDAGGQSSPDAATSAHDGGESSPDAATSPLDAGRDSSLDAATSPLDAGSDSSLDAASPPDAGVDSSPDAMPSPQDGGEAGDSGLECGALTNCNGTCVDTTNNSQQCGSQCLACAACQSGVCTYATSCADLSARNPSLPDGTYTIQPLDADGGALPKFDVYCNGMGTSKPLDYLSLVNTFESGAGTSNYIGVPGDGACNCVAFPITRYWTKVHLVFAPSLAIDQTDLTYSHLEEMPDGGAECWMHGGQCQSYPTTPYATANECSGPYTTAGRADVDLQGTPFTIDPSVTIVSGGSQPGSGTATFNNGRQTLDMTGGGDCGYTQIAGALKLRVN
jgi:hypothetical protein